MLKHTERLWRPLWSLLVSPPRQSSRSLLLVCGTARSRPPLVSILRSPFACPQGWISLDPTPSSFSVICGALLCVGGTCPQSFLRKARDTHLALRALTPLSLWWPWGQARTPGWSLFSLQTVKTSPQRLPAPHAVGQRGITLTADLWHETCLLFSLDIVGAFLLSPVFSVRENDLYLGSFASPFLGALWPFPSGNSCLSGPGDFLVY